MAPKLCGVSVVLSFLWLNCPPIAAETSSWFKTEAPVFNTLVANVSPSLIPPFSYTDCIPDTKFITILKDPLKNRSESSHTSCAVQTDYGQHDTSIGTINLHDTMLAGPLKAANGATRSTIPIANSKHVVYPDSSGVLYGSYRYVIKNITDSINTVVQPNGSIYFQLKPTVIATPIKAPNGTLIAFQEVRFSANGTWVVGDSHLRGMFRTNIETGESLNFSPGYNHANGARPFFVSAISNDGRFVFATARDYETARVYDLSTCVASTDITKPATCQFKELFQLFKQKFVNFYEVKHAQFSTNNTLKLYVTYKPNGVSTTNYISMTAAGETESVLGYLATGDSFASGEGAYKYITGTDARNPYNGCHVSSASYPYLLAKEASVGETRSVACSGAKTQDIISNYYTEEIAQSKGKNDASHDSNIFTKYLVGYRPQLSFISKNKPAIITTSVGGNDIGFAKILLACLAPGTCYNSEQSRQNLFYTIQSKQNQLVRTYESMKSGAATNTRILVLGYPSLVTSSGNCALNVRLNTQEIVLANQIVAELNRVIQLSAEKAGVTYVDVEHVFNGYRLCENKSSKLAVNGLTAGNDKTFSLPVGSYSLDGYITGKESYHPNELGHKLYAQALLKVINGSNNIKTPSSPQSTGANPRRIVYTDTLSTSEIVMRGVSNNVTSKDIQSVTDTKLILRSDSDTEIKSIRSSDTNEISADFTIPSTTKPGLYTLALEAFNKTGESVEYQKIIYVAQSETDIDGDGINNVDEPCIVTDPSGVDYDQDGTDDACDNMINEPPEIIQASSAPEKTPTSVLNETPPVETNSLAEDTPVKPDIQKHTDQILESTARILGASKTEPRSTAQVNLRQSYPPLRLVGLVILVLASLVFIGAKRWRKRT